MGVKCGLKFNTSPQPLFEEGLFDLVLIQHIFIILIFANKIEENYNSSCNQTPFLRRKGWGWMFYYILLHLLNGK